MSMKTIAATSEDWGEAKTTVATTNDWGEAKTTVATTNDWGEAHLRYRRFINWCPRWFWRYTYLTAHDIKTVKAMTEYFNYI